MTNRSGLHGSFATRFWLILFLSACASTTITELLSNSAHGKNHAAQKLENGANADPGKLVRRGKVSFRTNHCFDCHSINGVGCTEGVSLSSVGLRRDSEFLRKQVGDPAVHAKQYAKDFNMAPNMMRQYSLSEQEIKALVAYLQTLKKPLPHKGQQSKWFNSL